MLGAIGFERVARLSQRCLGPGLRQQRVAVDPVEAAPEEVAALRRAEGEAVTELRVERRDERVLALLELRALRDVHHVFEQQLMHCLARHRVRPETAPAVA